MRFVAGLAVVGIALFASSGRAAEVPPPTVELRIRSVNQLLPTFEYLAGILNQAEAGKQGVEFLKTLTDDKTGIDGIDPTRPFGMSVTLTKDVIDSPVLVMLPLADEAAFLSLLRDKLSLDPKKSKNGVYTMDVPNLPAPVHFRFAQGYVVATVMNAANIDDAKFLPMKDFFAVKPEGIADLKVHLDRIPEDVTKVVLAQLELKLKDELEKDVEGEGPGQAKLKTWAGDRAAEVASMLMKQGKLLTWTVNAGAAADAAVTELRMTAEEGTPLAGILAGLVRRSGQPSVLATADAPALAVAAKLALPPEARTSFEPVLEALLKDAVDQAKPAERGVLVVALDAIKPTLSAGELDLAGALFNDADGKIGTVAFSMKLVKGLEIEKLLKLFGPFIPAKDAKVTLSADAVEGTSIHKIELTNEKTDFGRKTIWIAIRNDRLLVTVDPDVKRMKSLLAAKPNADAAPLKIDGIVSRMPRMFQPTIDRELLKTVNAETFGEGKKPADDAMGLSLTSAGNEIRLRFTAQGKALKFLAIYSTELKK